MHRWRNGNAAACKAVMYGFESRPVLFYQLKSTFIMGMFDYVYSFYPLPDTEAQNLAFQTKSFDRCLESFLITKGGHLHCISGRKEFFDECPSEEEMLELASAGQDAEYHGDVYFYTIGEDDTWYEYKARFTEGQLVSLERVPRGSRFTITKPHNPPDS